MQKNFHVKRKGEWREGGREGEGEKEEKEREGGREGGGREEKERKKGEGGGRRDLVGWFESSSEKQLGHWWPFS